MRYNTQNLRNSGSAFWWGRAWLRSSKSYDEILHWEWLFGKFAKDFAITASFGGGDNDSGLCLHVCIPWVFSIFLVFPHVFKCREVKTGIGIHGGSFWLYPLCDAMETRSDWPWWRKAHAWDFPWTLDWRKTELLDANMVTVYSESKKENRLLRKRGEKSKGSLDRWGERDATAKTITTTWPYTYRLKNGTIQQRTASIHIDRMTWKARWWPLIPRKKVRTSIDIKFDQEVGERSGSWKGGCTGCGYEMLPGETAFQTLCRMERERIFN